ncbi:unnamed protein product [Adineta ricciae]|uniref:Uncharacterized protein n=1 Tax=Adineta ricciae TaxID=249248 RepID=A0A815IWE1_ADIRI|nr:unnamed protein product [Adineta ricciae]CAF1368913.1 unnamed protein product [Adineta ricciae]
MMMPTSRLVALLYPNETCAYRKVRQLISSNRHFSPNICDEFGCNFLMYCLRFQYHRLLHFLLDEVSLDLDFSAKDQQGNTILHYAIIYSEGNLETIDRLIGKYEEFYVEIDQRNALGFTPLLFAAFCARYDLVHLFLIKTKSSPFVRDYVQYKNLFEYIQHDIIKKKHDNGKTISDIFQHSSNFFENLFPEMTQTELERLRCLLKKRFYFQSLPLDLLQLVNQRYSQIKVNQTFKISKTSHEQNNSKISIHRILQLYDPNPRPKILPPLSPQASNKPMKFKQLGTKITKLNAFARSSIRKKSSA